MVPPGPRTLGSPQPAILHLGFATPGTPDAIRMRYNHQHNTHDAYDPERSLQELASDVLRLYTTVRVLLRARGAALPRAAGVRIPYGYCGGGRPVTARPAPACATARCRTLPASCCTSCAPATAPTRSLWTT